jgi:CheY-like chemotaxis protein
MPDEQKSRILVVEDEALVSLLIEEVMLDCGVEMVGPATKLDQALDLARNGQVDAAVLDINLAGVLTYPVADILRERGIPFVFASGYGAAGIPPRFQDAPNLPKPLNLDAFARILRSLTVSEASEGK